MRSGQAADSTREPANPSTNTPPAASTRTSITRTTARALYAMVTFSGEFGDIPYSGNFGVRYVDNDTSSEGQVAQPYGIDFSDETAPEILIGAPEFISQGHAYDHLLPSFNVRLDPSGRPRDPVVGRQSHESTGLRPNTPELERSAKKSHHAGWQRRTRRHHGGAVRPGRGMVFRGLLDFLGGPLHEGHGRVHPG